MTLSRDFEVTLLRHEPEGNLVFLCGGQEQVLSAAEASAGEMPGSVAEPQLWDQYIGLVGNLRFSYLPTAEAPALFSFAPYGDQTLRRERRLDDATAHFSVRGWRSLSRPAGYLAPAQFSGNGA